MSWVVVLDANVPAWEEERIRRAAQRWEAQTRASCPTRVLITHGYVARGPDDPLPSPFVVEVTMGTPPAPGAVGWAKTRPGEGARVILLPNATANDRADFPRVAEHELGHAFGLDHGGFVMLEPGVFGAHVNEDDAWLFAHRWCGDTFVE